jgi:hypothetical protein
MKNLKYYLFALSGLLMACNDEFLDTAPKTQINDNTFWKSPSDLKIYNNQLYSVYLNGKGFGRGGFSAGMFTDDMLSDNAFATTPSGVRMGTQTSNAPGLSNWSWSLVRNINIMLEKTEASDIDPISKSQYMAEARLIRALDYYDKLKLYGQLPIIDHVLEVDDPLLYDSQSGRDEVMAFILADLDYAAANMAETAEQNRFDKFIAHSYRARILLHEGTFRKYHGLSDANTFLQEAAASAQEVINSGRYLIKVNEGYGNLFSQEDLKGNKEVIFFRDYDNTLQLYHNLSNFITHVEGGLMGGTKDLVRDYLCVDGLPIEESPLYQGDDNITNEFTNRDKRLAETFAKPGTFFVTDKINLNSTPGGFSVTSTPSGYQVAKFFNASQEAQAWDRAFADAPMFRYAEILLILAEAKAELNTLTQADIDLTINVLRKKAGVAPLSIAHSAVLEEIRRERRVELAFEGFRYDDLIRWKEGKQLSEPVIGLKFNADDITNADKFVIGQHIQLDQDGYILSPNTYAFDESKNYYFPVPLDELSLNQNLKQTPGWE